VHVRIPDVAHDYPVKPSIDEETQRAHRRQSFWQIYLPLIAGILFAVVLFVSVIQDGTPLIEHSAQIASILLAIPIFISGSLLLFLLIGANYGVNALIKWLPAQSVKAQRLAKQVNSATTQITKAAKQPFLLIESWSNAVDRIIRRRG